MISIRHNEETSFISPKYSNFLKISESHMVDPLQKKRALELIPNRAIRKETSSRKC